MTFKINLKTNHISTERINILKVSINQKSLQENKNVFSFFNYRDISIYTALKV